jgi:hypothetical protein
LTNQFINVPATKAADASRGSSRIDRGQWKYISHPASAFALAARDNVLHNAGLEDSSVAGAQQFFDLSREELAEFSCVCGGSINNNQMAERIERIAARSAT